MRDLKVFFTLFATYKRFGLFSLFTCIETFWFFRWFEICCFVNVQSISRTRSNPILKSVGCLLLAGEDLSLTNDFPDQTDRIINPCLIHVSQDKIKERHEVIQLCYTLLSFIFCLDIAFIFYHHLVHLFWLLTMIYHFILSLDTSSIWQICQQVKIWNFQFKEHLGFDQNCVKFWVILFDSTHSHSASGCHFTQFHIHKGYISRVKLSVYLRILGLSQSSLVRKTIMLDY